MGISTTLLARAFHYYRNRMPGHRAKEDVVNLMGLYLMKRPFPWSFRDGFRLEMRLADRVSYHMFDHGVWEPEVSRLLKAVLRPGDSFVDVGANIGYFSLVASVCVGATGHVLAVEPMPETYEWLCRNVELNATSNIETMEVAIGADAGSAVISLFASGGLLAGLTSLGDASLFVPCGRETSRQVGVQVVSLDAVLAEQTPSRPMVLKMDVEGSELAVLHGAKRTLASCRPLLLFEVNALLAAAAGWRPADLLDLLENKHEYQLLVPDTRGARALDRVSDIPSADQRSDIDILAYCPSVPWHAERVSPLLDCGRPDPLKSVKLSC